MEPFGSRQIEALLAMTNRQEKDRSSHPTRLGKGASHSMTKGDLKVMGVLRSTHLAYKRTLH